MAIRHEELSPPTGGDAVVYKFPFEAARARRRMLDRRRRAGAVLTGAALTVSFWTGLGEPGIASRPGAPRAIVVQTGDTLWEIAARYAPEGVDLRAYIDALEALNGLSGPLLAGRSLNLPR